MITLLKRDLTVLVQFLFTTLVTLLLMSMDVLPQKEFTGTKRKLEGMTQPIKGWICLHQKCWCRKPLLHKGW